MSGNILITGGAGYIGSHVAHALLEDGFNIVIIDNLSTGKISNLPQGIDFFHVDLSNYLKLIEICSVYRFDAAIHFAASIDAADSIRNPLQYYTNNSAHTLNLLSVCIEQKINKFIFSSTAAVYGLTESVPIPETTLTRPISPYGHSKLMIEQMLDDFSRAYDLNYVALRYFNVAGSNPFRLVGPAQPSGDLISRCCQTVFGLQNQLTIFGNQFDTGDGTAVRDFIHPDDLAQAHLLALKHLFQTSQNKIYNCGYGRGCSVLEVIQTFEQLTRKSFPFKIASARDGDPVKSIADSQKIQNELGWTFQYDDLKKLISTSLQWAEKEFILDPKSNKALSLQKIQPA